MGGLLQQASPAWGPRRPDPVRATAGKTRARVVTEVLRPQSVGGAPGWTRTSGPELRRLVLYPPELRAHSSILAEGVRRNEGRTRVSVSTRAQKYWRRCALPGLPLIHDRSIGCTDQFREAHWHIETADGLAAVPLVV